MRTARALPGTASPNPRCSWKTILAADLSDGILFEYKPHLQRCVLLRGVVEDLFLGRNETAIEIQTMAMAAISTPQFGLDELAHVVSGHLLAIRITARAQRPRGEQREPAVRCSAFVRRQRSSRLALQLTELTPQHENRDNQPYDEAENERERQKAQHEWPRPKRFEA